MVLRSVASLLVLTLAAFTQSALASAVVVSANADGVTKFKEIYFGSETGYTIKEQANVWRSVYPNDPVSPSAYFEAEVSARSDPGAVGTMAYATVMGLTTSRQGATASAWATFQDRVVFDGIGSTLIEADILFNFEKSSSPTDPTMGGSGSSSSSGYFFSIVEWYFYGGGLAPESFSFVICNGGAACERSYTASNPGQHRFEREVAVTAGRTLEIKSSIESYATALLYNSVTGAANGGSAFWTTAALNSARNGITVLTDGLSFTADSGHDYKFVPHVVGTVSEPATLAMLGLGLAGLRLSQRRKTH